MKITRHCLRALGDLVFNKIFQLANLDEVTLGKLNLNCPVSCSSERDCVSRQSWDYWASTWALHQGFVGRMSIPHKDRTDFEWKDVIPTRRYVNSIRFIYVQTHWSECGALDEGDF